MNFLLVGNSRFHWAEYFENEYKFFHTNKNERLPKNIKLNNLIWASVGKSPNFLLEKKNEIKTNEIKLSNLPSYFGVDRALASFAALKIIDNPFSKDFLIADCGTILSLTKLDANGYIIGGQLSPGFTTQLRSMDLYTKNLTVPDKYIIPSEDFLINTEDATLKGVLNSITGMINNAYDPSKDILITCGGDSKLISEILKTKNKNIMYEPNLVMEGMIIHFQLHRRLL